MVQLKHPLFLSSSFPFLLHAFMYYQTWLPEPVRSTLRGWDRQTVENLSCLWFGVLSAVGQIRERIICPLLMPRFTTSCAAQTNYWAAWWFHGRPVTACWTGVVDGSYIVKHLLKPPLQGVCLSAFACVWRLHGHYCSASIWMEPSAHWRFTTSCEKARWPDICLCGSAGQRREPRGWRNKSPQVELREWQQRLIRLGVCTCHKNFKTSERRCFCRTPRGVQETHFHPRPPSWVSKAPVSGSREAAPSPLNVRGVLAAGVPADCDQSSTQDPRVAPEVAPKQRTSELPLNCAERLGRPLCHILWFDNWGLREETTTSFVCYILWEKNGIKKVFRDFYHHCVLLFTCMYDL